MIKSISYASFGFSWFICMFVTAEFGYEDCVTHFGAVFLNALGYITDKKVT